MDIQLSQHHLLRRQFPIGLSGILVKDQLVINVRIYFWALDSVASSSMSHGSTLRVYPYANTTQSWLLQLCRKFWNQEVWVLQLCASLSILIWWFWVLCISTWILELVCWLVCFCKKKKKDSWNFERDRVDCVDQLGSITAFLTRWNPPVHECGTPSHLSRSPLIFFKCCSIVVGVQASYFFRYIYS